MKLSARELTNRLVMLGIRNKWPSQYSESLEILFEACEDESEVDLISRLVDEFVHLDNEEVHASYRRGISTMRDDWNLAVDETLIVAIAGSDSEPDSSHQMSQSFKLVMAEAEWEPAIRPSMKHLFQDIKGQEFRNIVLIDQFIGTGDTMANKARYVDDRAREVEQLLKIKVELNLYIFSVAAMAFAREQLEAFGATYERGKFMYDPDIELAKGISEKFAAEDVPDKIDLMKNLEAQLDRDPALYNMEEFPSLGYGESEALFAIAKENVPNSVFPIFWWRYLNSGNSRKTLFTRAKQ